MGGEYRGESKAGHDDDGENSCHGDDGGDDDDNDDDDGDDDDDDTGKDARRVPVKGEFRNDCSIVQSCSSSSCRCGSYIICRNTSELSRFFTHAKAGQ